MTAKPKPQATPATPDDLDARLNKLAARIALLEARLRHHFGNAGTPDAPPPDTPPPQAGATP
jgi:hypothetical protein